MYLVLQLDSDLQRCNWGSRRSEKQGNEVGTRTQGFWPWLFSQIVVLHLWPLTCHLALGTWIRCLSLDSFIAKRVRRRRRLRRVQSVDVYSLSFNSSRNPRAFPRYLTGVASSHVSWEESIMTFAFSFCKQEVRITFEISTNWQIHIEEDGYWPLHNLYRPVCLMPYGLHQCSCFHQNPF